jgi:vitamin B12/bleomycin/antimicrobial peptide transport system ATP-binding/permease protein
VQEALSFFVSIYRTMAEWRAVVARLDGFEMSVRSAADLKTGSGSINLALPGGSHDIDLTQLLVRLPNGTPLISASDFRIHPSERLLVIGPSGAGKSTLFRAIAGIWPFGSGSISIPADASLMMLPQKPYFPIGTLHAAIAFPSEATAFGADRIKQVLTEVGLPQLALRIEDEEHWNRILSLGEQQRLGIARALLQAPKFLFLDEATASLDEPAEAVLYRLLQEKLPDTTVVSIGHRATLDAFHQRKAALAREGDHFVLPPSVSKSAKP